MLVSSLISTARLFFLRTRVDRNTRSLDVRLKNDVSDPSARWREPVNSPILISCTEILEKKYPKNSAALIPLPIRLKSLSNPGLSCSPTVIVPISISSLSCHCREKSETMAGPMVKSSSLIPFLSKSPAAKTVKHATRSRIERTLSQSFRFLLSEPLLTSIPPYLPAERLLRKP